MGRANNPPHFFMTAIPPRENNLIDLIDKAHEAAQERPRPHFGASQAGHKCDRWLWLSFRWAVQPKFPGRILRLFRRGHHEENWIVEDLKAAGVRITHTGTNQKTIDFGCHIGGSVDGIIESGVPEAPTKQHVAEFKTHALKSFTDLQSKGVEKSKPVHYWQMQLYMLGTGIDRALYVAVCKNDDQLYMERIRFDKKGAEALLERCKAIVLNPRIPDPISTDPSWYECKFCDAYDFCHKSEPTKHVNCRTCAHSTAVDDGTWLCERHNAPNIPVDFQHEGCGVHVLHPDLVPWELGESTEPHEAVYIIDGRPIRNGDPGEHVYASTEILANPDAVGRELVKEVRRTFPGAKVVKDEASIEDTW